MLNFKFASHLILFCFLAFSYFLFLFPYFLCSLFFFLTRAHARLVDAHKQLSSDAANATITLSFAANILACTSSTHLFDFFRLLSASFWILKTTAGTSFLRAVVKHQRLVTMSFNLFLVALALSLGAHRLFVLIIWFAIWWVHESGPSTFPPPSIVFFSSICTICTRYKS